MSVPVVDPAPCAVEATLWRSCLKEFDYGPDRPKGACENQRLGYYSCIKDWTAKQGEGLYDYRKFNLIGACAGEAEKLHQCMMVGMFEISNCKEPMAELKRCGARHDVAVRQALEGDSALQAVDEEPQGIKLMRGEHELVIPGEQRRDWCSTDACENRLCRKKFSLLVSKQHCQWCGRIFCDNCAPCTATYGGRRLRRCNSCKFPAVFRSLRNLRTGKRDGSVARLIMSFLDSRSINALMHSCYTSLSEFNVGDYVYYESITDRFPTFFEGAMIGKGGFGSVYKCEDRSYPCRRRVALKVITKASVVTYRSWKKIVTELEIMQDVDHHNVAKLLEVLQTPHHLVIVMEAGDGGSLMQAWRLAKEYKYDVEVLVANVVLQVAEGLDYLYHKKGIVHRDIKLENIVLSHDFKRVMIIDFGLAEYVKQCETQLFVPCGTAGYTSPENIRAVVERRRVYEALGETMHLADMYSLGVVAYVLLCGHMPVATRCFSSLYQNMLKGIRCVGPHWANVSDDAKSLVESLVKTNSSERATVAVIREHPFIQAKAPLIVEIVQRHMHKQTETERREVKEWVYVEPLSDHWDMIEVETVSAEENRGLALRKGSSTFGRVGFMNRLKSVVWD